MHWLRILVPAGVVVAVIFLFSPPSGRGQQAPTQELPANLFQPQAINPSSVGPANEEFRTAGEVNKLLASYGGSKDEGQRTKIKSDLSKALTQQFDFQQKRREEELSQLEAQVKKLRDLMRKRTEVRGQIIEQRVEQLLREADGLGWSEPKTPIPRTSGNVPLSGFQAR